MTGISHELAGVAGMADNGGIPDGTQVAYLKATSGNPASLDQALYPGITLGKTYELSFQYNASDGAGNFDRADMTVTAGSTTLVNTLPVAPVGGDNPYYTFEAPFTPTNNVTPIIVSNADTGPDGTSVLLVDDFAILNVVPEPSTAALLFAVGAMLLCGRRPEAAPRELVRRSCEVRVGAGASSRQPFG